MQGKYRQTIPESATLPLLQTPSREPDRGVGIVGAPNRDPNLPHPHDRGESVPHIELAW